jgi:CheY-like chemotaxis protein
MHGTVLIVNEDVNQRIIEETLLQARGLPVRAVSDGGDACDLLVRDGARIAVVVVSLELNATGMNGWELLRHLHGRFDPIPLSVEPRIVVTTSLDPPAARFAARLGADVVLQRPIAPRDFIGAVERLLHRAQTALVPVAACS